MTRVNNPIAQTVNYRLLSTHGSAGDPVILPVFKSVQKQWFWLGVNGLESGTLVAFVRQNP